MRAMPSLFTLSAFIKATLSRTREQNSPAESLNYMEDENRPIADLVETGKRIKYEEELGLYAER